MTTLYAQPYNLDAAGFYFDDAEAFTEQSENLQDRFGNPVEEFEIQFIDGDDAQLFEACGIHQGNLQMWFDSVEVLGEQEKAALFYLCRCLGYSLDDALEKMDEPILYEGSLQEAAAELFDEIYLHDIPEAVRAYIDYERFAKDCELGGDMTEFEYNATTWTCTNAANM